MHAGVPTVVNFADPSSLLQLFPLRLDTNMTGSVLALSLSHTRVTRTSGIAFSAAFHDCSSCIVGLCLHFVRPAFEGRTQTDLHLLRHLILLHLLDHRNMSPHAPGDLGNLIDDLHLKNLHDFFLQYLSSSALTDLQSLCLPTGSVPSAQLRRPLFFQ